MMASHPEVDEVQFFDTRDEITSVSDSDSDSDSGSSVDCSNPSFVNYGSNGLGDEFWTKDLESVHERRERFLKWMDFSIEDSYSSDREELGNTCVDEIKSEVRRIGDKSEAMLAISEFKNRNLLIQSSPNCQSIEDHELIDDVDREESEVFINQTLNRLHHEHDSNEGLMVKESEIPLVLSSFDPQLLPKEEETSQVLDKTKKVKKGWLQKLSVMGRIGHKQEVGRYPNVGVNINKVRVHTNKKRMKELSSVYVGQDFQAHKGSILTMKFSPDGQYLASGGEDSVVRVWNVIEDESQTIFNIQNSDPSCLYFSLNHLSKLAPLSVDKEKTNKNTMSKKSSDSACVIFPPKVFRLLEKPVHEFHGHTDKILALSWSKNGHLISSSVDKTVRIWQVGNEDCVGVFSHNNYVTCVEFNPVDDNFFISGSIDGKVRIWEVSGCQVVDWIDVREIVSAVCYFPDGKGGIVGSFDGSCRFYDIIDNRLEKGAQICLQGKKKLPGKRITGFQFSPSDPSKVMVTSADSQVRILCGVTVVCKFKGARSSGNQLSAFFTLDGKHIISASEDSNIYTWNYINQDNHHHRVSSKKPKKVSSCETFSSRNASTAIPWCGNSKISQTLLPSPKQSGGTAVSENVGNFDENLQLPKMPLLSPPDCFSLSRGFFLESLHRGNATWPEEKLPPESPRSSMAKSEYKLLKNAYQNTFTSPHMWGHVIVTAGWDGRIRTFLNYGLPIRT